MHFEEIFLDLMGSDEKSAQLVKEDMWVEGKQFRKLF
jgi:hypothetical protein